jgi:N5-(cytidine 5'-diphosphoramidyl)-L-glutamine hydrolase
VIVLVSMRSAPAHGYVEERDALARDWAPLLEKLGLIPAPVLNGLSAPERLFDAMGAAGLLLTGGDGLGPLTGEAGGPAPTLRDAAETRLLAAAAQRRLPVLAVCRGLQMVNAHFGGRHRRRLDEPHVGPHQAVALRPFAGLAVGESFTVNSYHDEGVLAAECAPDLTPLAVSAGGVMEACVHARLPIIAMQWHPERADPSPMVSRALLAGWLAAMAAGPDRPAASLFLSAQADAHDE